MTINDPPLRFRPTRYLPKRGLPEEFESISEGVGGIKPLEAGEWLVIDNLYSTVDEPTTEILQILDVERGMGFARRSEILIDSEMNSNQIGLEPAPATGFQMTGLFNLGDSQHSLIKGDRPPLPSMAIASWT